MDFKALFSEWEDWSEEYGMNGCVTYPVELTTEHSASSYGQLVALVNSEPRGPAEMRGGELQVPPEYLASVRSAGFAARSIPIEDLARYWQEASGRPIKRHWHPEARLVIY